MLRKSTYKQLIEITSLLDVEVISDLRVTPIGQVLWCIVNGVESVSSDQSDGIRQDGSRYGVRWGDTHAYWSALLLCHWLLGFLRDQAFET